MLREKLNNDVKEAMKSREQERLTTLRLVVAAIKDREISERVQGVSEPLQDKDIIQILTKMVKQRDESARVYEEGGRLDLAERERREIALLQDYLPKQMSEAEIKAAIEEIIGEVQAESIKDLGKVMAVLKEKYAGQMDFGIANRVVKERLV